MNSLQQFLLENPVDNLTEEVVVSPRLQEFKFKIRALSGDEFNDLQARCVDNPNSPKKRRFNTKKFNELVVISGSIEPNFKDVEFLKEAGCVDPIKLLYKVMLPGEINALSEKILNLSGFGNEFEDEVEEVKN